TTRLRDWCLVAVERPSQDPGARGFPANAGAGEEVGVVDPVVRQGGSQRLSDMVLTDHLGERLRPVAAVKSEGGFHTRTLTSRGDIQWGPPPPVGLDQPARS